MNVLIAGTGILGRNLIKLYLDRGDHVRALARLPEEFAGLNHPRLETRTCDVTRPDTLKGLCDSMALVISCIGITRMKGALTHMDVDFQGNANLLQAAEQSGVKKFGFISPEGTDKGHEQVPLLEAKYRFETMLMNGPTPWLIFRAGGFFSDLLEMGRMARRGTMMVIGNGNNFFTPIDVRDLAEVMVADLDRLENQVISVGGPEDLSWIQICNACFERYKRKPRILAFPASLCRLTLKALKPFSKGAYAMGQLMVFMSTDDFPSQKRGRRRFSDYLYETI